MNMNIKQPVGNTNYDFITLVTRSIEWFHECKKAGKTIQGTDIPKIVNKDPEKKD